MNESKSISQEWQSGDVILDLYRVKGVLGEGGMGRVYRVHHTGWNLDLAVKTPLAKHLTDKGKENFTREAETWVNLGLHPHTVSCYYVREIDGLPRVFAECVEGGSLKDWIDDGRLYQGGTEKALERILDIAIQFAWGLHYSHEQGLVHQDVKPGNLMMTPDGTAKVTDFGLAQARAISEEIIAEDEAGNIKLLNLDPSKSVVVKGSGALTPAYCSPEQKSRKSLTRKTDIWSWAASILEMFTGGVQWQAGEYVEEALNSYIEEWAENERTEADDIPRMPKEVEVLLRRCFKPKPPERPKTMLEAANKLKDIYQEIIGNAYSRKYPKLSNAIADSLNNQANSLIDLGKRDEALKLWDKALKIDPYHTEAIYNRGLTMWRDAEIDDLTLINQISESFISKSDSNKFKYYLGLINLERDDIELAIKLLDSIDSNTELNSEVNKALKTAYIRLNDSTRLKHIIEVEEQRGGYHTWRTQIGRVFSSNFSPDGSKIISGSDLSLKLWDVDTGEQLRDFKLELPDDSFDLAEGMIFSALFSPNGKHILISTTNTYQRIMDTPINQSFVQLWDVASGNLDRVLAEENTTVYRSAFNFDGTKIAYGFGGVDYGGFRVLNILTDKEFYVSFNYDRAVFSIDFSPNNQFIVTVGIDHDFNLWCLDSGRCEKTFKGHGTSIESVKFSPDGNLIISSDSNGTVKIWEVKSGNCQRTIKAHKSTAPCVSFSREGNYVLVSGGDGTVKLFEVDTWRCIRTFEGHTNSVFSTDFSPDSKYILSGAWDGKMMVWYFNPPSYCAPYSLSNIIVSEAALKIEEEFEQSLTLAQESINLGNNTLAIDYIQQARSLFGYERNPKAITLWSSLYRKVPHKTLKDIWELPGFKEIEANPCQRYSCLSPDGKLALSVDNGINLTLWDVKSRCYLKALKAADGDVINSIAFHPNGDLVLSATDQGWIQLWEVQTGNCISKFERDSASTFWASFSPDGAFVLACNSRNKIGLWETKNGKCLRVFEGKNRFGINSVTFSPDGNLALSAGGDDTVQLWDVVTGQSLQTFYENSRYLTSQNPYQAYRVCFSPNSRFALSTHKSGNIQTIRLWNIETKEILEEFKDNNISTTFSICFTADSKFAVSGHASGKIRIWNVLTGTCLRVLDAHKNPVNTVSISQDDSFVLSSSDNGTLKFWFLDWELEDRQPVNWDDEARIHLQIFLIQQTPYALSLDGIENPTEKEITLAITRRGIPIWNEDDFQKLLYKLGCAGFGYINPAGVRRELKKMVQKYSASASVDENLPFEDEIKFASTSNREEAKHPNKPKPPNWFSLSSIIALVLLLLPLVFFFYTLSNYDFQLSSAGIKPKLIYTLESQIPVFSPNGKILITQVSENIKFWEAETGKLLNTASPPDLKSDCHKFSLRKHSFSPDGNFLAVECPGDEDFSLPSKLTNSSKPKPTPLEKNQRVASIAVFDLRTGILKSIISESFSHVLFLPDNKTLLTRGEDILNFWDFETGELLRKTQIGNSKESIFSNFSPSGDKIFTWGQDSSFIVVRDTQTGKILNRIDILWTNAVESLPYNKITSVESLPDNNLLIIKDYSSFGKWNEKDGFQNLTSQLGDKEVCSCDTKLCNCNAELLTDQKTLKLSYYNFPKVRIVLRSVTNLQLIKSIDVDKIKTSDNEPIFNHGLDPNYTFSPNYKILSFRGNGSLILYDVDRLQFITKLSDHNDWNLSPDGNLIAIETFGYNSVPQVKVWSLAK